MSNHELLILKGTEVHSILKGRETEVMRAVRNAYVAHAKGDSSLPHSTFLNFPNEPRNRIIALPAFLADDFQIAGLKWIASFPANNEHGLDRASAVLILNSAGTGLPVAVLEASIISAKRTAASAALAAKVLHGRVAERVGLIGCGLINYEIARFLLAAELGVKSLLIYDLTPAHAEQFKRKCGELSPELEVEMADDVKNVLRDTQLISFATTAIKPHIMDPSAFREGSTILHVSLRDLAPEVILACDNVVDDIDHVARAQTSIHLAEQLSGNREFIRCTLAQVLMSQREFRRDEAKSVVFSPFGLGVLDLAVGQMVLDLARDGGRYTVIDSFLPEHWVNRS
jgi:ornithine cyclodeaminase